MFSFLFGSKAKKEEKARKDAAARAQRIAVVKAELKAELKSELEAEEKTKAKREAEEKTNREAEEKEHFCWSLQREPAALLQRSGPVLHYPGEHQIVLV